MDKNSGNIVAIVSVVMSAVTTIYSTWDKGRIELILEDIKGKYDLQKTEKDNHLVWMKERCAIILEATRNLGQTSGKVYRDLGGGKAELEASLWSAAAILSPENKKIFLSEFQKNISQYSQHGTPSNYNLISIALQGLAIDGQNCLLSPNSKQ